MALGEAYLTGSISESTELIAVISAAIASVLGVEPEQLIIKNIVRVPETAPIWNMVGRIQLTNSGF